jgi:hypothetical protein
MQERREDGQGDKHHFYLHFKPSSVFILFTGICHMSMIDSVSFLARSTYKLPDDKARSL